MGAMVVARNVMVVIGGHGGGGKECHGGKRRTMGVARKVMGAIGGNGGGKECHGGARGPWGWQGMSW